MNTKKRILRLLLSLGIPLAIIIVLVSQMADTVRANARPYTMTVTNGVITQTLNHMSESKLEPQVTDEFSHYDIKISSEVTITQFLLRIVIPHPSAAFTYGGSLNCEKTVEEDETVWICQDDLEPVEHNFSLLWRTNQAPVCFEWFIQTQPTSDYNPAAYDLSKIVTQDCSVYLSFVSVP